VSANEVSVRNRAAALERWSKEDGVAGTAKARQTFRDRFVDQVDPDRLLPEAERLRRAQCARRAFYVRLAYKSAVARQRKRS
jgi:hypothetical protein